MKIYGIPELWSKATAEWLVCEKFRIAPAKLVPRVEFVHHFTENKPARLSRLRL